VQEIEWSMPLDESSLPTMTMISLERPAGDIRFMTQGHEEPFLTLKPDGTIEVGSFVKPDEAARLFLDSLADLFPQWRPANNTGGAQ
jgi:hypothetical protein